MTTVAATERVTRTTTRSTWRAIVVLGLREGRRMLLSPALLGLLGFIFLMVGVETVSERSISIPSDRTTYETIIYFTALYLGMLMYAAAHLVTSSARRAGADGQLAASALSERQRNVGACLGALFGPGAVALVLMTTAAILGNDLSSAASADSSPPLQLILLVQIGLTLIGGALFGVMWATWLRFPGSLPLGFLALIFATVWLGSGDRSAESPLPWFMPYITAPDWFDEPWTAFGSHYWHAIYLAALCTLAFCATMLRSREYRGRWLAITFVALCATGVVGGVQLA